MTAEPLEALQASAELGLEPVDGTAQAHELVAETAVRHLIDLELGDAVHRLFQQPEGAGFMNARYCLCGNDILDTLAIR